MACSKMSYRLGLQRESPGVQQDSSSMKKPHSPSEPAPSSWLDFDDEDDPVQELLVAKDARSVWFDVLDKVLPQPLCKLEWLLPRLKDGVSSEMVTSIMDDDNIMWSFEQELNLRACLVKTGLSGMVIGRLLLLL